MPSVGPSTALAGREATRGMATNRLISNFHSEMLMSSTICPIMKQTSILWRVQGVHITLILVLILILVS
jgi:hypothetical protein